MNAIDIASVKSYFGKGYPVRRIEFDGSNRAIYVGIAARGSASSSENWLIFKLTYTGNNPTLIESAPANSIWDNRTSLDYR